MRPTWKGALRDRCEVRLDVTHNFDEYLQASIEGKSKMCTVVLHYTEPRSHQRPTQLINRSSIDSSHHEDSKLLHDAAHMLACRGLAAAAAASPTLWSIQQCSAAYFCRSHATATSGGDGKGGSNGAPANVRQAFSYCVEQVKKHDYENFLWTMQLPKVGKQTEHQAAACPECSVCWPLPHVTSLPALLSAASATFHTSSACL